MLGRDTMTTATFLRESIVWGLLTVSEVEPVVTVVVAFTVVGTVAAHSHIVLERFCIQIPRQQGEREREPLGLAGFLKPQSPPPGDTLPLTRSHPLQ